MRSGGAGYAVAWLCALLPWVAALVLVWWIWCAPARAGSICLDGSRLTAHDAGGVGVARWSYNSTGPAVVLAVSPGFAVVAHNREPIGGAAGDAVLVGWSVDPLVCAPDAWVQLDREARPPRGAFGATDASSCDGSALSTSCTAAVEVRTWAAIRALYR